MKLSFRWYGEEDKVTLEKIRQIPGIYSIVSAVYDLPVGGKCGKKRALPGLGRRWRKRECAWR